MLNRVYFRVEWWKDAGVWLPVPYSAENYSLDDALNALELVEQEANYDALRVVKVTEEIVNA